MLFMTSKSGLWASAILLLVVTPPLLLYKYRARTGSKMKPWQESVPFKSKKNHRKGKAASSSDQKSSAKKDDDTPSIFSEEKLCQNLLNSFHTLKIKGLI